MRDNSPASRPYMGETTVALAALIGTRPARDVLVHVAQELAFRHRPAARRLADEVAAMLSGSVAMGTQAPAPARRAVVHVRRKESRLAYDGDAKPAPVADDWEEFSPTAPATIAAGNDARRDMIAELRAELDGLRAALAARDPASMARKPRAVRVAPRPGDVGWKPRTLEAIARALPPATHGFGPSWQGVANPLSMCREAGLLATGWRDAGQYGEGYVMLARGEDRAIFCPTTGAIYHPGWSRWDAERRDHVTRAGRDALAKAEAGEESFAVALKRLHGDASAIPAPMIPDARMPEPGDTMPGWSPVSDADALALVLGATDPAIATPSQVMGGYVDESTGIEIARREDRAAAPVAPVRAAPASPAPRAPRKLAAPARKPRPVAF